MNLWVKYLNSIIQRDKAKYSQKKGQKKSIGREGKGKPGIEEVSGAAPISFANSY